MMFPRKGRKAKDRAAQKRSQLRRFVRPALEALEDRIAPAVNLLSHYTGLDFNQSLNLSGGSTPPDSNGAAGPFNVVETVNQVVAIYSPKSTGSSQVSAGLATFFSTTNTGVKLLPNLTDPFTIYDPQINRFIVGDVNSDLAKTNHLLLAVSKTNDPLTLTSTDWTFYNIDISEPKVALQDYPGNPGYNADALVVTFNSFSSTTFLHSMVTSININQLVTGGPLAKNRTYFVNDDPNTADASLRPTTMQDSKPGDPMWLIEQNPNGADNSINVLKMTNILSTNPTFTTTTLPVNPYIDVVNQPPRQPDGTVLTTDIDSRIQNAMEENNTIVAAQSVGNLNKTEDDVQWYAIDVSSGTPTMQQQGDVSAGNNTYLSYPAIAINAAGDIGMTYMQSGTGAGQFLSMYVTGRTPFDPAGTMEAPVLVEQGFTNYHDFATSTNGRVGDLSGINVDANGSFWAVSEFANSEPTANWGTAIANFAFPPPSVPPPPPPPFIPAHLPIYALDALPVATGFVPLQGSLTTLADAEIELFVALLEGGGGIPSSLNSLGSAYVSYYDFLLKYESNIAFGL
jgi:hypothetical protein